MGKCGPSCANFPNDQGQYQYYSCYYTPLLAESIFRSYLVRNMSFDEICHKHLYLGNYGSIKKEPCKTFGISHVVNCTRDLPPPNVKTVQFLRVPIDDSPNDKIGKHFEKMTRKIFDIIKTGGKVLVTCRAGISRSSTMVIAFLMRYHNMSLTDAHRLVKTQRPKVRPNDGFWKQLVEYERTLFNNSTVHFIRTKAGVIPSVYLVDTAVQMATEKQEAT